MLFGINVWNFSFNVLFCRLSDCSQRVTVVQIQLFVDSVHLLLCSAVYFFFFPSWAASVYFKCCSTYPSHKGCCRRRINRFIFIKQTLAPWLGTTQGLLDQLSCIFFFLFTFKHNQERNCTVLSTHLHLVCSQRKLLLTTHISPRIEWVKDGLG